MVDVRTSDLFDDSRDVGLESLVRLIRDETEALGAILPEALERQWIASPVPKPREDTTERSSGGRSDPTGDSALDGRRLKVRQGVKDAESVLRQTAIRVRGARLFLERSVAEWEGRKA